MLRTTNTSIRRSVQVGLLLCVLAVSGTVVYLCLPRARASEDLGDPKAREEATGMDLDTDTNNNGIINDPTEEDKYEEYPSGRVVCLDRKGDDGALEDYAEIAISPPDTDEGTLHLEVIEGEDKIRGVEESLPASWSPPTSAPAVMNIDGIKIGQAKLRLWYEGPTPCDPEEDIIAIYVTETISWSPADNDMNAWEACCWEGGLPPLGSTALRNQLNGRGWDLHDAFEDTTDHDNDVGSCTLPNFKTIMPRAGVVYAQSHGDVGEFSAVYLKDQDEADDWWRKGKPDQEPHMRTVYSLGFDMYEVVVDAEWFGLRWSSITTARNAIVFIGTCHSSAGGANSVVGQAMGRVGLGYPAVSGSRSDEANINLFFGRMNGSVDSGDKRTAGKAYGNGSEYQRNLEMLGGTLAEWTTLNPAPNAWFPATDVGYKAAGNIIFDTYMDEAMPAGSAVQVLSGHAYVWPRRWFANDTAEYLVAFDFEKHPPGSITTQAVADFCRHKMSAETGDSPRKMSGDRVNYGSDWDWSF